VTFQNLSKLSNKHVMKQPTSLPKHAKGKKSSDQPLCATPRPRRRGPKANHNPLVRGAQPHPITLRIKIAQRPAPSAHKPHLLYACPPMMKQPRKHYAYLPCQSFKSAVDMDRAPFLWARARARASPAHRVSCSSSSHAHMRDRAVMTY
jgi:hypothetical protein